MLRGYWSSRRALAVGAALLVISGLVAGCRTTFPVVPRDDAGDQAWVRQVVPIVLGRKVKGYTEVKLLADLVQLTDRPTVLRGLMRAPEFNEHWSETLINTMRIDRETTHVFEPDQSDCYGAPLRGAPTSALAQHIQSASPASSAAGGAFNMSDVVRSAVALDNLAPLYRANLFALQHHQPPLVEQQARDELGRTFAEVYLHRQNTCLLCHNSDTSTTGPSSNWNRHYPIVGSFEQALYGASTGGDPMNIHAMFRTDQHGSGPGFVAPWGISGCGSFKADMVTSSGGSPYFTGALSAGATVTTLASLFKQGVDGLALHGLSRSVPPTVAAACNICKTSCSGTTPLDPDSVVNGTFVRDLLTAHGNPTDCGQCHGGTQDLWFYDTTPAPGEHWYSHLINVPSNVIAGTRVIPGDAANSELIKKLRGTAGARMPLGGAALSEIDIQKVEVWINALPPGAAACTNCATLDCDTTHIDNPPEAFAYLSATRIVNTVWQEAMGYPLTIANYFPRNFEQRGALWNLTEFTFIPSGWSLRELLVRILTADTFNRRPPEVQSGTGSPYREPQLYDPWLIPDPRIPPASDASWDTSAHPDLYHNAMTDGIYRYSAWNLLRSTQKAMDWPGPNRFPSNAYPSAQLERDIGQYLSIDSPGFRVTNFPALLSWEHEHGTCSNHRTDNGPDWIDRLTAAAASFTPPATDPGPLTVRDLVKIERDWLLSDGAIASVAPPPLSQTEEQGLAALVGSLDTSASSLTADALSGKLRTICGVLLETPQFLLAGVAPEGPGAATRFRVCNGAPCTYHEICTEVTNRIPLGSGVAWLCGEDSVSTANLGHIFDIVEIDRRFCPECPVVQLDPKGCFGPQVLECRVTPPACNPKCSRIDCCGGPLPRLDRSGTILLSGEGAFVKQATGVRVRRPGSKQAEALPARTRLSYGDILELPPGALLVIDNAGREMKYQGKPADNVAPRYVLITGARALQSTQRQKVPLPLSSSKLEWMRTKGWARSPDGSTPITITPEMRGPGAAEKQWQDHLKRRQQQAPP